jgi:hypothetical protein
MNGSNPRLTRFHEALIDDSLVDATRLLLPDEFTRDLPLGLCLGHA